MENITVRVRLLDERGMILLVLERSHFVICADRSFMKPLGWGLPGGRMTRDKDKTPRDTAIRELWEETGVTADISPEPLFKSLTDNGHEIWVFEARNPRGQITITDPYIIAAKWFDWKWIQLNPDTLDKDDDAKEDERVYIKYNEASWPVYKIHLWFIHGLMPELRMRMRGEEMIQA